MVSIESTGVGPLFECYTECAETFPGGSLQKWLQDRSATTVGTSEIVRQQHRRNTPAHPVAPLDHATGAD
jgi:hypothetical protein